MKASLLGITLSDLKRHFFAVVGSRASRIPAAKHTRKPPFLRSLGFDFSAKSRSRVFSKALVSFASEFSVKSRSRVLLCGQCGALSGCVTLAFSVQARRTAIWSG